MMLAAVSRTIATYNCNERAHIDFVENEDKIFATDRLNVYPLDPSFMTISTIPEELGLSAKKTVKWLLNHHYFPSIEEGYVKFHVQSRAFKIEQMQKSNPQLQLIYRDKHEQIPHFYPFARKTEGCAMGTIFKKSSSKPDGVDKKWMGKVGQPESHLQDYELTRRSRTKKAINLDGIREKLASDCYAFFGMGSFIVPKTCLSEQLLNNWSQNKDLEQHSLPPEMFFITRNGEILSSLRVMSRFVDGYTNFDQAVTCDEEGQKISFMQFIEKFHRPPMHLLTHEGKAVPLSGIIEMIAVGRILSDTDLLGGAGKNAGYIWIEENGEIIRAQTVKIDPGCAFNFACDPDNSVPAYNINWVLNTHEKLSGIILNDIRDIQVAQRNHKVTLNWESLTFLQKEIFIKFLLKASRYLEEPDILHYLFFRDNSFYKDNLAELPLDDAQKFQKKIEEWLKFQIEIYSHDIELFLQKNPQYYRDITQATLPLYPGSKSYKERQIAKSRAAIILENLPIGSGYLVRENLVLTAATPLCYENSALLDHARIKELSFIFDHRQEKFSHYSHIGDHQLLRIKKVIAHSFCQTEDWALVKIDQKMTQPPLTLDFIARQNFLENQGFSIVEKYIAEADLNFKLKKIKAPHTVNSPGFYLLGICLNGGCTTFNQPTWRALGYGTFQWDEILHGSSCKLCDTKRPLKVINAGIYHSQYLFEGELESPKKAMIHKTGSVSEKMKTLDQETPFTWDSLKITVSKF